MVGQPTQAEPITVPAPVAETLVPKLPDIDSIEADLRSVLTTELRGDPAKGANGKANGHANGAAAEH